MKFSIVIPAHNEEELIGECLDSILGQTHKDFEALVVCDACTDRTADIVRSRGIEPIEVDHRSLGLARNAGLRRVTAEYFLCLDGNDRFATRDALKVLAAELTANPVDIIGFGAFFGSRLANQNIVEGFGVHWPNVTFNAFKSAKFKNCMFTDSSMLEDREWWVSYIRPDHTSAFLDLPLYEYRYPNPTSLLGQSFIREHDQRWGSSGEALAAREALLRVPVRLDLRYADEMAQVLAEAASWLDLLVWPTIVFVTAGEPSEEVEGLTRVLGAALQSPPPFTVVVEGEEEFRRTGDPFGFMDDSIQISRVAEYLYSMRLLSRFYRQSREAFRSVATTGPVRLSESGFPPSHGQALDLMLYHMLQSSRWRDG